MNYVIDQFSVVEEASKIFTSDVHFVQANKQMMEFSALPKTSNMVFSEMKFCVRSLSLRLHRLQGDLTCSEIMAEAEMHFVCSLSLMNGQPHCFNISFSSLALFSFLSSVVLAEFSCPQSDFSVLDMNLSILEHGDNRVVVSFPCLELWWYMCDWSDVIDLLSLFSDQLSKLASGASEEGVFGTTVDNSKSTATVNPNHYALDNINHDPGCSTLILEHVDLVVHFPELVSRDTHKAFGRAYHDKQTLDENSSIAGGHRNCFVSLTMQSRNIGLITDGKTVKLTMSSENLNAILKLFKGENVHSWPLFQLSTIYLEAEVFEYQTENVHMSLLVRCDSLDLSLSNHILYLYHFTWFTRSEEMPSRFYFKRMDIKVQLRKFSLLLTDWKVNVLCCHFPFVSQLHFQ